MKIRSSIVTACILSAASACSNVAVKAKADSVAARDSAINQDSLKAAIGRTNDSLAAAAGNAAGNAAAIGSKRTTGTGGETRKVNDPATSTAPPGTIIGRDSAVGPRGMIDANGHITKIKHE